MNPKSVNTRLALLAAVVIMVHVVPVPLKSRLWASLMDSAHVILMGGLALFVFQLSDRASASGTRSRVVLYLISLFATISIGATAELAQLFSSRDADIHDLFRDAGGAAAFLLVRAALDQSLWALRQGGMKLIRSALILISGAILAVALEPTLMTIRAFHHRNSIFPVLCTFDVSRERLFWTTRDARLRVVPAPPEWKERRGSRVGHLRCRPSTRAGFAINEPYGDWRSFQTLTLDVFLEGDIPRAFTVQLQDRFWDGSDDDRYPHLTELSPGENRVVVPLPGAPQLASGRVLDLGQMAVAYFYVSDSLQTASLFLGTIALAGN